MLPRGMALVAGLPCNVAEERTAGRQSTNREQGHPMQPLLVPAALIVGLIVGALIAWLLTRGRVASQVELAVGKAEGALQGELAQLRERVRQSEESRPGRTLVHVLQAERSS